MKASRNYILGEVVTPPVSDNSIVTTIKFSSAPTSAIATRPLIKFGKKNWFSLEWDDASVGSIDGLPILDNAHFTDGCGNNISYKAAVAFNGAYEGTGAEYTYDTGLTTTIMHSMIEQGWDLEDHGYYHDPVGFGANVTPYDDTAMMQDYAHRLLGYWLRGKVVPQNYEGHATAARDVGYLFSTSQGTFDDFTPIWMYAPPGDFTTVPAFAAIRRDFTDEWANTDSIKALIDDLLASTNCFYRLGSHTIDVNGYQSFIDYVQSHANDQLLVVSTREILEYREVGGLPTTQNLVGDTLTITTDLSGLDSKNRWKDQCFNIASDKQIISVTTTADSATFNPSTGLVNTFKQDIYG